MSKTPVLTRIDDHVGIVSINLPEKHNAMDDPAQAVLLEAMQQMSEDPDVDAPGLCTNWAGPRPISARLLSLT